MTQVSSAISRMTVKTESNLAASLAVVKIVIQQLSDLLLEQVTGVSSPPSHSKYHVM